MNTAAATSKPAAIIDLTTALPPAPLELDQELRATLAALAQQPDLGLAVRQNRVGGSQRDRGAGALWLRDRLGPQLSPEQVLVTNGTQSALQLLLHAFVGHGAVLAAESLTYVVLRTIASRLGISMVGVPLDDEGIIPDAFAEVCRTHRPKALYCNPTIHNPTAAVMSRARRLEVIAVAREHGVLLIEDDVLGAVHPEAPAPIARLAPEITWYVMSLSKCHAMGLRMAYLAGPDAGAVERLLDPVRRLSSWFPNSLSAEITSRWVFDGNGRRIANAIRRESDARQLIAAQILDMRKVRSAPGALHLWLAMPDGVTPRHFAAASEERGVLVRPADLFAVDGSARCDHVRISLTGPKSREELQRGLSVVRELLDAMSPENEQGSRHVRA